MIVVTGATGSLGSKVIENLLRHASRVRASVRKPENAGGLAARGVEVRRGDYDQLATGCENVPFHARP